MKSKNTVDLRTPYTEDLKIRAELLIHALIRLPKRWKI